MLRSVLWHKEEWALLLRCFRTLAGCMGQAWQATSGVFKCVRPLYVLEWLEPIVSFSQQPAKTRAPSPLGKWCVAMKGGMSIASEVFHNTSWVHGEALKIYFWYLMTSKASGYSQMLGIKWIMLLCWYETFGWRMWRVWEASLAWIQTSKAHTHIWPSVWN